jgi:ABC-type uncharacterized transport system permease subunit
VEDMVAIVVLTLSATLRVATPLILGALAGLFSERSGIIDICLEGKMLASAFAAATAAALCNSAWIALAAGIAIAGAFAPVHGYACITRRGNQVVSGLALNMLASGLTIVLGNAGFIVAGRRPACRQRRASCRSTCRARQRRATCPCLACFTTALSTATI